MAPADVAERLAVAHRQATLAGQLLVAASSEAWERCQNALQEAAAQLTFCQAPSSRPGLATATLVASPATAPQRENSRAGDVPRTSRGAQGAGAELLEKAYQLRAQVRRAGRLIESAALFYGGWNRILGAMSGGYTASGEPAPVQHPGKLCWRG